MHDMPQTTKETDLLIMQNAEDSLGLDPETSRSAPFTGKYIGFQLVAGHDGRSGQYVIHNPAHTSFIMLTDATLDRLNALRHITDTPKPLPQTKPRAAGRTEKFQIAGTRSDFHRLAQSGLPPLYAIREPDNAFDENAILILAQTSPQPTKIGYVPAKLAITLAKKLTLNQKYPVTVLKTRTRYPNALITF